MEQKSQGKKIFLSVLGIALLMVLTSGATYAFFNYSRTGSNQSISTGHIEFLAENTLINLANAFPTNSTAASAATSSTANVGVATVTVTGKTNYSGGIDFTVTAVELSNNIGTATGKLPVKVLVSGSGITGATYLTTATNLTEGLELASGNIADTNTTVNGTIKVKAYIDDTNILVTDTASNATPPSGYTNNTDTTGKTVLTTSEWNAYYTTPATFKIRVDATEHTGA